MDAKRAGLPARAELADNHGSACLQPVQVIRPGLHHAPPVFQVTDMVVSPPHAVGVDVGKLAFYPVGGPFNWVLPVVRVAWGLYLPPQPMALMAARRVAVVVAVGEKVGSVAGDVLHGLDDGDGLPG